MTLRLLHTADWQLGKSFAGVPGDAAALLREARFQAVRTLARLAGERQVDAVLVAGDVFDDNLVGAATLARALAAMREFVGPWVLLPGNHDADTAASVWSRLRRTGLPDNVILATVPEPLRLAAGRLAVLPAPLGARRVRDDLSAWMDEAVSPAEAIRVGLAHGSVEGRLPGEADAGNPIAADRAQRARLDYLALGDWHGTIEVAPRTWYSGTPEPDRYPTNEPGNALVVEIEAPGAPPRVERVATASYRWSSATLDCTGLDQGDVAAAIETVLPAPAERHRTLLRLRLSGVSGLATRAAIDTILERASGEMIWLDVVADGLATEPDERDLAALAEVPATAAAARTLQDATLNGPAEERDTARLALRLLYAAARALERRT
jgi:DNA repair exonuclease SbcCD nuclease subunit